MSSLSTPKELVGIFFQNGRLNEEFVEDQKPIGSGSYGVVTKARHKIDDKEYAIKKLIIKDKATYDKTIRERKVWAKLDTDFFVQYRSSWVELVDNTSPTFRQFLNQTHFLYGTEQVVPSGNTIRQYAILHVQMDLCSLTLREALDQLKYFFGIKTRKQILPEIGYYISSQLLIEILECIKYLHESDPQIIHRDIKPNNILIKDNMRTNNRKFVKISDFGEAVEHISDMSHTSRSGTLKYMAPEVLNCKEKKTKYDTSADVYSIGVMTQEMFNFDINVNIELPKKYEKLLDIASKAMSNNRRTRPKCAEWLDDKDQWQLTLDDVRDQINNQFTDLKKVYDIEQDFVPFFIKKQIYN